MKALYEHQKSFGKRDKIIVFGCGGHARSVVNAIHGINSGMEIILADWNAEDNEMILGCRVEREYEMEESDGYIIAVGDNRKRQELYRQIQRDNKGLCVSIIAAQTSIGMDVKIDQGTFVAPAAYIGPQAEIGFNTIINTGSIIEHETIIGNHTHIAPGVTICGRCKIGDYVFCGAGSTVIDKISICDQVVIGAGAVVIADIHEAGTYAGVPAKKVK